MDPLSAVAAAASYIALANRIASISFSIVRGYNFERQRTYLPRMLRFLKIFDVDLSEEAGIAELTTFRQSAEVDIRTAIASQAGPPSNGIRIYLDTDFDLGNQEYLAHLRHDVFNNVAEPVETADGPPSGWDERHVKQGFRALCQQWMLQIPETWFEVSSFILLGLWARSRLREFAKPLVVLTKEVCIIQRDDGTLTMLVSCKSYTNASAWIPGTDVSPMPEVGKIVATLEKFIKDFSTLVSQYHAILKKTADPSNRKMILLLWFKHAQLLHMMGLTEEAKEQYYSPSESKMRRSKLLPQVLESITTDAYMYKEFAMLADNYATDLESLVDVVGTVPGLRPSEPTHTLLQPLVAELRGLCSEFRRSTTDMPETLEHHLRFLEMRRNMEESSSLWVLTVLASIFLPLGLACGILSMQTRVKDLHYLLYDFCGVVVVLLTLVAVILALVKSMLWLHGKWSLGMSERPLLKGVDRSGRVLLGIAVFSTWAVFFASFIVGMFKDVRLGGLVLGYGFAGLTGLGLLFCVATALLWRHYL